MFDETVSDEELARSNYEEYVMPKYERESINRIKKMLDDLDVEQCDIIEAMEYLSRVLTKYENIRAEESTYEKTNVNMDMYIQEIRTLLENLKERL